jgi:hypothetical protein
MKAISVITPMKLTKDMVKEFVERIPGGFWHGPPTHSGAIERGQAAVYVWVEEEPDLTADYEEKEFHDLIDRIGGFPRTSIALEISHRPGSDELAHSIATEMALQWNGSVEDD